MSTIIINQVYNPVYQQLHERLAIPRQCLLCKTTIFQKNICHYCNKILIRLSKKCLNCRWPISNDYNKCELCVYQKIQESNHSSYTYNYNNLDLDYEFAWSDIKIAFSYIHPIDKIIQQFKYLGDLTKGRLLAELLLEYICNNLNSTNNYYNFTNLPEVIIPVPIYYTKLKQRGFNQSLVIAKYLSKKLSIPIDNNLIVKHQLSHPQMGLDQAGRISNLENTFCLNKKAYYKSAVIIDDVVTTGSTVAVIAQLLRKTKIKNISLWAVARRH
ncbi:MAG: ComF family protein [Gammaproteobacteria bacterium]|nr:ComF family protein [Gammaproteobacteria bacterium]